MRARPTGTAIGRLNDSGSTASDAVAMVPTASRAEALRLKASKVVGQTERLLGAGFLRRLDAYVEETISLWDIAAGWLMIEEAGGCVTIIGDTDAPKFSICATNGHLTGLL